MKKKDKTFKPVGRWIAVDTTWKKEKTTESGIVYNETQDQKYIKSKVVAVSDSITEDIKINDIVFWDMRQFKGQMYKDYFLIHESWVALVDDGKE